ncbi:MAG TPA: hypothetical protein PLA27_12595 [Anaerolineales bacterium]|nr:hypothetical protein [Anaerolineales bacterium]HQX17257.1 hypothetical protein [Anaerolineales bacterium]
MSRVTLATARTNCCRAMTASLWLGRAGNTIVRISLACAGAVQPVAGLGVGEEAAGRRARGSAGRGLLEK